MITKVVLGPSVWQNKPTRLLKEEGDEVVVEIEDKDDAGSSKYEVRMPRAFVRFEDEPKS